MYPSIREIIFDACSNADSKSRSMPLLTCNIAASRIIVRCPFQIHGTRICYKSQALWPYYGTKVSPCLALRARPCTTIRSAHGAPSLLPRLTYLATTHPVRRKWLPCYPHPRVCPAVIDPIFATDRILPQLGPISNEHTAAEDDRASAL